MQNLRRCVLSLIAVIVLSGALIGTSNVMFPEYYTKTGVITFKCMTEEGRRHHSRTNFLMVVDFEHYGKEDVNVSASIWSSYDVGDKISLQYKKDDLNVFTGVCMVITGICLMIVFLLFVSC